METKADNVGNILIWLFPESTLWHKTDNKLLPRREIEVWSKGAEQHGEGLWPELQGRALGKGVRPGRGARHLAKGFMGII